MRRARGKKKRRGSVSAGEPEGPGDGRRDGEKVTVRKELGEHSLNRPAQDLVRVEAALQHHVGLR